MLNPAVSCRIPSAGRAIRGQPYCDNIQLTIPAVPIDSPNVRTVPNILPRLSNADKKTECPRPPTGGARSPIETGSSSATRQQSAPRPAQSPPTARVSPYFPTAVRRCARYERPDGLDDTAGFQRSLRNQSQTAAASTSTPADATLSMPIFLASSCSKYVPHPFQDAPRGMRDQPQSGRRAALDRINRPAAREPP
jgi:hypothetical protein